MLKFEKEAPFEIKGGRMLEVVGGSQKYKYVFNHIQKVESIEGEFVNVINTCEYPVGVYKEDELTNNVSYKAAYQQILNSFLSDSMTCLFKVDNKQHTIEELLSVDFAKSLSELWSLNISIEKIS